MRNRSERSKIIKFAWLQYFFLRPNGVFAEIQMLKVRGKIGELVLTLKSFSHVEQLVQYEFEINFLSPATIIYTCNQPITYLTIYQRFISTMPPITRHQK